MIDNSGRLTRKPRFWILAIILAVVILVLLVMPTVALLNQAGEGGLIDRALQASIPYQLLAAALTTVLAAGLGYWLNKRKQTTLVALLVFAMVFTATVLTTYQFRRSYPYADVLNADRIGDSIAILLGTDIRLRRFQPNPKLVVERKTVTRASFPVIDVHFHFDSLPPSITPERLVQAMDATGIAKIINLDGNPGDFEKYAATFVAQYPDRFLQFAKPNFSAAVRQAGGVETQVQWIREAAKMGARGLKVNKSLGLQVRDSDGKLLAVDDARLDPIWSEAGRLGLVVLVHTGDPPAFFDSVDPANERYEELSQFPDWSFHGPKYPSFDELLAQRERLLERHPETVFIGAHIGANEEDLAYAGRLLDRFPNYNVDMSSRVAGLGRQPRTAREFFIKYQDRILFGSDGGFALESEANWTPERFYRSYIEFLETDNEYIEYPLWGAINQGRWRVQGLNLPADVLEKLYVRNAERLLPTEASIAAHMAEREGDVQIAQ